LLDEQKLEVVKIKRKTFYCILLHIIFTLILASMPIT